jgi:hypothetical protein
MRVHVDYFDKFAVFTVLVKLQGASNSSKNVTEFDTTGQLGAPQDETLNSTIPLEWSVERRFRDFLHLRDVISFWPLAADIIRDFPSKRAGQLTASELAVRRQSLEFFLARLCRLKTPPRKLQHALQIFLGVPHAAGFLQRYLTPMTAAAVAASMACAASAVAAEVANQACASAQAAQTKAAAESAVGIEWSASGAPVSTAAKRLCVQRWISGATNCIRELPASDLARATDDFSELNTLGGGGSCTVFRGMLYGLVVAIKQLKADAGEWDDRQFASEMGLLCNISPHQNICSLFAYSIDGRHRCLVLEFCAGGPLDARIASAAESDGQPEHKRLLWHHRLRIMVDVASSLVHLHSLTPPMLHRDVKSQNVLLDYQGGAKLADFGTVREGNMSRSHFTTQCIAGTRGYMPPVSAIAKHCSERRCGANVPLFVCRSTFRADMCLKKRTATLSVWL